MRLFRRYHDLQPWLDYFEMLHTYEQKGFLEVFPEKHEAYITEPALFTLSPATKTLPSVVRRIRTYAGWRSQYGGTYLSHPFALHVVDAEEGHDLLYTLLLTRRRVWWKLWMKTDRIEVIEYGRKKKEVSHD